MSNKVVLKGNAFLKALAESEDYTMKEVSAMMDLIKGHVSQQLANDMLYELLAQSFDENEKDSVLLKDCGSGTSQFPRSIIPCIKQVRHFTNLGLKEAKDLCELVKNGSPQYIIYNLNHKRQDVLRIFRSIGALVE